MCDVCVADNALRVSACGKDKCPAFEDGYKIAWSTAPRLPMRAQHARSKRKHAGQPVILSRERPTVYVRARGKGSECKPAQYQIRREGEGWPKAWTKTEDLAGVMARYGFDVKWHCVARPVQDWLMRRRPTMPSPEEILEWRDSRRRGRAGAKQNIDGTARGRRRLSARAALRKPGRSAAGSVRMPTIAKPPHVARKKHRLRPASKSATV